MLTWLLNFNSDIHRPLPPGLSLGIVVLGKYFFWCKSSLYKQSESLDVNVPAASWWPVSRDPVSEMPASGTGLLVSQPLCSRPGHQVPGQPGDLWAPDSWGMRWTLPVELGWENAPKWKDGGRAHAAPVPGVSCLDGTASGSWFPQPEGDLKNSKKGAQKREDPLRGRARGRVPSCLSSCQIAVRKKRWLVFGFFFS